MNNQKKIEDLLVSINELVIEARNEKENVENLSKNIINENHQNLLEQKQFTNKTDINRKIINKNIETTSFKELTPGFQIKKSFSNIEEKKFDSNWQKINFKQYQKNKQSFEIKKISSENIIRKVFEESLNNWIEKNIDEIIKKEASLYTKKIIEDKLK